MAKDSIDYSQLVEQALRDVVRRALARVAETGLPGSHHFFITFRTDAAGVDIPERLQARFPHEMTLALQHEFWDLKVSDTGFSVVLSFDNKPETLTVPFAALLSFADPSVKFGLQFGQQPVPGSSTEAAGSKTSRSEPASDPKSKSPLQPGPSQAGEVVTLDSFRKK
jgi:hypothetical protein